MPGWEWEGRSGDQFLDDLTADLAELLEPAAVEVGQLGIVQPEQVQDRGVQVADWVDCLDRLLADLVGGADDVAGPDAAAGEPDGHGLGVVVAAVGDAAAADAVVGRTAELAA